MFRYNSINPKIAKGLTVNDVHTKIVGKFRSNLKEKRN